MSIAEQKIVMTAGPEQIGLQKLIASILRIHSNDFSRQSNEEMELQINKYEQALKDLGHWVCAEIEAAEREREML